jgi:lipopolysaccharide/colanic/teichoic acid biosynthesis glycosyltransferase
MFKFRSMVNGAHIAEFRLVRAAPDGGLFLAKSPHDGRVTRLGRFLRRASLDELPQLINVLKGEMSLVGPRPDLPQLLPLNDPRQAWRLLMLPGMTGWWQVNGRMQRAAPHQRLADDLFYLHHWSLGLDMQILGKTVMAVIRGDGAF